MIEWKRLGVSLSAMPVFVSYFTDGAYMVQAFDLARSMKNFPLDYVIREVPSKGSWEGNTNFKPKFLLQLHQEFPDRNLCWVDADARIRKNPVQLMSPRATECAIAFHFFRGISGLGRPGALSGTVLLTKGPQRLKILEAWEDKCRTLPYETDQACMDMVRWELKVPFWNLPEEYAWIFDLAQKTKEPSPEDERAVIEHMQASRVTRRLSG